MKNYIDSIISRIPEFRDWIIRGIKAVKYSWTEEYKNILKDLGALALFFGVQIAYPLLYPLPFYQDHESVRQLPVAVVDQDKTSMSRMFTRMADANENMDVVMQPASFEEAKQKFLTNAVNGVVIIPKGFTNDLYQNRQTEISVYCDASYFYIYKQVLAGVNYVSGYMSAGVQIRRLQAKGMSEPAALAARDPLPLTSFALYNPSGSYAAYLIPVVLILILQQTLLIGVGALGGSAFERGKYHYLAPTVSRKGGTAAVVIGKAGAYLSLFFLHALYFYGVVFKFHNLPMKSDIFTLMIFSVPFLLAVIFLAIALSTIFRTREMAILLLLCTSIPFVLLSGFSWPLICMPDWLHGLAMLLPSTEGIDGIIRITAMGAGLRDVMSNWLFLWGLVILYFLVSLFAFKIIVKKTTQQMEGNSDVNPKTQI